MSSLSKQPGFIKVEEVIAVDVSDKTSGKLILIQMMFLYSLVHALFRGLRQRKKQQQYYQTLRMHNKTLYPW